MSGSKISIVTPSFNQVGFVEDTLRSVLDQDYPHLEYVVIDGASTDGSVEIIEKYKDRLHHFVSEPDTGHGNALNKGFAKTSGEIMAWLNSDDKYCPWTFRTVAEIFDAHPDVMWIAGCHGFWNDRGTLMSVQPQYKNIFDYAAGNFTWIQQETVFWRRALWERAGGHISENYRFMVDGELWTRFFLQTELWHATCALGGYRRHRANRAAHHQPECQAEMMRAIADMQARATPEYLAKLSRDYRRLAYDVQTSSWMKTSVPRP